jgi:UPF0716 protein FxsA
VALLALLLLPFVDAVVLVVVATEIGWVLSVAIVVLTALVGMMLVRAEGRHTLRKIQRTLMEGQVPTNEIIDGGLLLIAGAFLLTPGLVTDTIGFLLVIPPSRYFVRMALKRFVLVPRIDSWTDGFGSGAVYTFGFPEDADGAGSGTRSDGGGSGGDGSGSAHTYNLGPDEYEVNVEDDADERES